MTIPMIDPGKFRHALRLNRETSTSNASGEAEVSYVPEPSHANRAEIRPLSGSEPVQGEQQQATVTHEITMWFDGSLDPAPLAKDQWVEETSGEIYEIVSVIKTYAVEAIWKFSAKQKVG